MSSLEERLVLEGKLPDYYRRYVDDTLTIMPNIGTATDFLHTLNDAHPSVSFTMEIEKDGMLPFLGTQLLNRAPQIETKVYVKPTNTGLLVHYQSYVDNRYKRNLLTTMLDRAYRLSSSWLYFSEECERLKYLFSRLDYPHHLFNAAINTFINSRVADQQPLQALGRLAKNDVTRVVIPFKDQGSANVVKTQLKDLSIKFQTTIQPVFVSQRICQDLKECETKPQLVNQQSVVYQFKCNLCDTGSYVGYTRGHLYARVDSHKSTSSSVRKQYDNDHAGHNNPFPGCIHLKIEMETTYTYEDFLDLPLESLKDYLKLRGVKNLTISHCAKEYCSSLEGDVSDEEKVNGFVERQQITDEEAAQIERETKGQSSSRSWKEHREGRITASNFKDVSSKTDCLTRVRGTVKPKTTPLVSKLIYGSESLDHVPAVKWGQDNEDKAFRNLHAIGLSKHRNCKLTKSGLHVMKGKPYIGASPDGFMECSCCGKAVLEIKCPYSIRKSSATESWSETDFLELRNDAIQLKRDHKYYLRMMHDPRSRERYLCNSENQT
ncbi:hypothetical protein AWC38_SpisGene22368 [Stylophora pistillata]|uniref:Uncharacterized protein n=1 Tax=Stylophora pistillata TaxID=50429 RepID=A0A2B4R9Q3_STYPI|nr:hypothetical protein AWC38_SpisGene22368 [Stylophora pistillata]